VAGERQVGFDGALRHRMHGHEPGLAALALDPEVHHTLAALDVPDPQPAQLRAAHAVIEQGGQNGAIARALERVCRRRLQQLARLGVAQAGVLPSLPFAIGRLKLSTGLPDTALRSQR
jgi:hypothetical protein